MKYKKIILIILLICWMATIFTFSAQASDNSSETSGKTIKFILDRLPATKNMNDEEKYEIVGILQTPIRKLAHFSIYTVGGILAYMLFNQYDMHNKKKFLFSFLLCAIYSITDEIHQYFVPGRSCELRDMIIDSSGAILGILITYLIVKVISKKKKYFT